MKIEKKQLLGLSVFIISFIVYLITSAPGLMFTDSGELAGASVTLGIAHPTGYPLFIILSHLWSLLPLPFTKIQSLNFFASFLVALSTFVFYQASILIFGIIEYLKVSKKQIVTLNKHKKSRKKIDDNQPEINKIKYIEISAFISALIYAFAFTIWDLATMIEVYPLQVLLFNIIIFYFIKSMTNNESSKHYLIITALFIGLAFSNHLTTILILPAVLIIFLFTDNWKLTSINERAKYLLVLFIPLIIGVSPYLYLIIRSASEPMFNWGGVSRGFDKFIYHVSGKQFQEWMFTGEGIGKNVSRFFELLPLQLAWLGIIPLVFGFFSLIKYSKLLLTFFILMIIACFFYAINYSIHDIDSYFSLAFISILFICGIGIFYISDKLNKYTFTLLLIPILSFIINYSEADKSQNSLVNTYTELVIRDVKPNAIIISSQWDYFVSAFWYKQTVENYRKDIDLVEKELLRRTWYPIQLNRMSPDVCRPAKKEIDEYMNYLEKFESGITLSDLDRYNIQNAYIKMIRTIIDSAIDKRPIYVTPDIFMSNEGTSPDYEIVRGYNMIPEGLAYRLIKDTTYIENLNPDNFKMDYLIQIFDKLKTIEKNDHLVSGLKDYIIMNVINGAAQYCNKNNQKETGMKIIDNILNLEPDNVNLLNIRAYFSK